MSVCQLNQIPKNGSLSWKIYLNVDPVPRAIKQWGMAYCNNVTPVWSSPFPDPDMSPLKSVAPHILLEKINTIGEGEQKWCSKDKVFIRRCAIQRRQLSKKLMKKDKYHEKIETSSKKNQKYEDTMKSLIKAEKEAKRWLHSKKMQLHCASCGWKQTSDEKRTNVLVSKIAVKKLSMGKCDYVKT